MPEFERITRLPPYVFNITTELKMAARRRGEDVIDDGTFTPIRVAAMAALDGPQERVAESMRKLARSAGAQWHAQTRPLYGRAMNGKAKQ